jgi:hypothetical protein
MTSKSSLLAGFSLAASLVLIGCHSAHVEVTVENHTGGPIRLLEVDYPSASFGADTLATGAVLHYRIQVQGSGPVKVQYTPQGNHPIQFQGPDLSEGEEGNMQITFEPEGKYKWGVSRIGK